MKDFRVVITGSTGFIGGYITRLLSDNHVHLTCISRRDVISYSSDVKYIKADLLKDNDKEYLIKCIESADVLIHAAANINVPGNDEEYRENVHLTENAIKIAKRLGITHFIYLSSIPIIGKPIYIPVTEKHPVQPGTLYHKSKYQGELLLNEFDGIASVIRIPSPIGCGMRNSVFLMRMLKKCIRNEPIEVYGRGGRIQNYIDVRDIATAVKQVIEKKPSGVFLIGGISISNIDLAKKCVEISKSDTRIITGRYDDPEENVHWVISTEKAKRIFGFSSKYSLDETINWIYEDIHG